LADDADAITRTNGKSDVTASGDGSLRNGKDGSIPGRKQQAAPWKRKVADLRDCLRRGASRNG